MAAVVYVEFTTVPERGLPKAESGDPAAFDASSYGNADSEVLVPPLDSYSEIIERPLFSETRRPIEEEDSSSVEAVAEPKKFDFTLLGVVINVDERFALVQRGTSRDYLRLGLGESIDGWVVESIMSDRVVLKSGERTEELELKEATPPPKALVRPRAPGNVANPPQPPLPNSQRLAPPRTQQQHR